MSIKDLKKILIPPPSSDQTANHWSLIETQLSIKLPCAYKIFIDTYGTECIDDFLWVLNPFARNKNLSFDRIRKTLDAFNYLKTNIPEEYNFNLYPENPGLFPWASTDNGDDIFWFTEGDPDTWPIIVYETRSPEYIEYKKSVTDFIYEILSKQLICPFFPDDFPSNAPVFRSVDGDGGRK